MKKIYFDHSATTPVDNLVLKKMLPYFSDIFGNPSSIHNFGQKALAGVDKARLQVANFLNCDSKEIIFTSGATEADNMAIKGVIAALSAKGIKNPHIIVSLVEHDAVLEPAMELSKNYDVDFAPVKPNGVINLDKLFSLIKENTVLVSIMYVNSEVGAVMPVKEIGKKIKKIREKRLREYNKLSPRERKRKPYPLYFHTDATQAINFFSCDVKKNYIDLLSLSAHKIYGPKGVGALYKNKDVPMLALQRGGHHENNMRSGTLNVSGIVGLGAAISAITPEKQEKNNKKIEKLRNYLIEKIQKQIKDIKLNTDIKNATPAHAHFSFLGVEGEAALMGLDMAGIAVSTGSACASGSLRASHVLIAMGIKKEIAHNSIRFSLGKHNTKQEIDSLVKILPPIIEKFRHMNPLYK